MKKHFKRLFIFISVFILILTSSVSPSEAATKYYKMYVHYIDVGESDSVLIQSDGKTMLIDAGNNGDGDDIVKYLEANKVKKLDYVICTHPHADHIGGMDIVIEMFDIGKIIMPDATNNTKTFEEVLDAIEEKGLKITKPVVGTKYNLGKAKFTILAPNDSVYDNLNDFSIAIKLVNGKNSFLFIGDSEQDAIGDILNNEIDINSDVYMCGHHGSYTSTTQDLIDAVTPTNAIISVGKNEYGHPHEDTLDLLSKNKITTYRTDENGTIVATSTGTKITFEATATSFIDNKESSNSDEETIVYITETGKRYHRSTCSYLSKSKIKTTLKEAKKLGLEPCSRCKPPE